MPALGDVIGALAVHIGRGRSQGDLAAVEVARLYREDPLLSSFPIPHVTVDEIVVDLKFAVGEAPAQPRSVSGPTRQQLMAQAATLLKTAIKDDPQVAALAQRSPGFAGALDAIPADLATHLDELIPDGVPIDSKAIGRALAAGARGHLNSAVTTPDSRVEARLAREFVARTSADIETRIAGRVAELIDKGFAAQPVDPSRLNIAVTASELQSIPPERIQTMRITFKESDRSWTTIEDASGTPQNRLVPA